jgi:hypothetical protein
LPRNDGILVQPQTFKTLETVAIFNRAISP